MQNHTLDEGNAYFLYIAANNINKCRFSAAFGKIQTFIGYFTFENVWILAVENINITYLSAFNLCLTKDNNILLL